MGAGASIRVGNIRDIQHDAGQLRFRQRLEAGVEISCVGRGWMEA